MQLSFQKKGQGVICFLLIGYVEETKELQFVDETFFAFFSPFGNSRESAEFLAEECKDQIRFAVIGAIQNDSLRFCGRGQNLLLQTVDRAFAGDKVSAGFNRIGVNIVLGKAVPGARWKGN